MDNKSFYASEEADEIRGHLIDYVDSITSKSKGGLYKCPLCGSGSGPNGTGAFQIKRDGIHWTCYSGNCKNGDLGDIFDLIGEYEGLTGKELISRAIELYGNPFKSYYKTEYEERHTNTPKKENNPVNGQIESMPELAGLETPVDNFEGNPFENMPAVWTDTEIAENKAENTDKHINTPVEQKTALNEQIEGTDSVTVEETQAVTVGQFKTYIKQCHANVGKTDYFKKRGFTEDIINRFSLGYDEKYNGVVIPYNGQGTYYFLRYVNPTNGMRFYKPNSSVAGPEPIFNPTALYRKQPVFVCEGQLDALSIIQAGGNAIAVGGTSGINLLIKTLKQKAAANTIILSLDPDEAGTKATKKAVEMLEEIKAPYVIASYSFKDYGQPVKDANDMLQANQTILEQDIRRNVRKAWTKQPFRPFNIKDYLSSGAYNKDINYFKEFKNRKIGFENIDKYLTLYPGLAALGGAASLGKTTFALNLCKKLMARGEHVLYFALEQEPIELVTKMLAMGLYERDEETTVKNIDIKNGYMSKELQEVTEEFKNGIADKFNIVRCNFTTTAEDIKKYVVDYIQNEHIRPIVVIDYLQLISPPLEFRGDVRTATDHVVKVLKTLQVENDLFVLMISNFNRASYNTSVSYESFKETGMIEFTCDYVWALQLAVMEGDGFYVKDGGKRETKVQDRNNIIFEENKKNPKSVCFVSLKSRNGRQCYKCFFKYFMEHDVFKEDFNCVYDKESEAYKQRIADVVETQTKEQRERLEGQRMIREIKSFHAELTSRKGFQDNYEGENPFVDDEKKAVKEAETAAVQQGLFDNLKPL